MPARHLVILSVFCLALPLALARSAQAQLTETILHSFGANDGPDARCVLDPGPGWRLLRSRLF